jgi:hypothetical protein
MMMNRLSLAFIALSFVLYTKSSAQCISVGPEVGINFSNMHERINGLKVSGDALAGLKIGGIVDIAFARHVSFQPGLFYSMKGFSSHYVSNVVVGGATYRQVDDARVRANYLELPLNFEFKFSAARHGNVFLGIGPYFAAAVGGKIRNERTRTLLTNDNVGSYELTRRPLEIGGSSIADDITPIDAGLNFNAGYECHSGLFFRGNLGAGLANIRPDGNEDNSLRNICFSLSVGYLF